MNVYVTRGQHHPLLRSMVAPEILDAHQHEDAMVTFYGHDWLSVLVAGDGRIFHQSLVKRPIGQSGFFDVEPILGYTGPVSTGNDVHFLAKAWDAYREVCRTEGVVAELIRFSPLRPDHRAFGELCDLEVSLAKQVVVVPLQADETEQFAQLSEPCRRRLRRGQHDLRFEELSGDDARLEFEALYQDSMRRLGAGSDWAFPPRVFLRAQERCHFHFFGVYDATGLAAGCLALFRGKDAHYVLAANRADYPPGAGELLVWGLMRAATAAGSQRLVLGGGVSARESDSLLRFKRRFAPTTTAFYIGKAVHDRPRYARLCDAAALIDANVVQAEFFLKYRLLTQEQQGLLTCE
jgi:UDP-N-acetylbacillosamine alanyltransferase